MDNEIVEDKNVYVENVDQSEDDHPALNVFVHSANGMPEAWTEEEVSTLLAVWREVLEQSPLKRFDIVRRVLKRLKETEGGFRNVDKVENWKAKDEIRRQMEVLRIEYQVFKGLQKIKGLKAVRHKCVDQLEYIIDRIPQARRTTFSDPHNSEDSAEDQQRRRRSVSEGESIRSALNHPRNNQNRNNQDEVSSKPRFQQRRMNLTRLVRVMVSQQQTMLEQLEKLFRVLEVSSERMARLAEVSLLQGGGVKAPAEDAEDSI